LGPAFTFNAAGLLFGFAAFFGGAGRFLPAAFFTAFFFAVAIAGYPPTQTKAAPEMQVLLLL
jgi:hypothetical protein